VRWGPNRRKEAWASGSPRGASGGGILMESEEERRAPVSKAGKVDSRGRRGGSDVLRGGRDGAGKGE
jgi:hypothetical protein